MKKTYEIKFPARTYTKNTGEEKTFWATHGSLFVKAPDTMDLQNVTFEIKIDSIPVSKDFDGWFKCYEKKQRDIDVEF